MAKLDLMDAKGKKVGSRDLPSDVFESSVNVPLMHQVVVAALAGRRSGTHSTKTRGEVSGGGKKPCLRDVELAGKKVNLAHLVEKAVEKRVNSYMTFKVEGGASKTMSRISLSRFRFHLDKGDPQEMQHALERALKFDVRLAQAMYNRDLDQAEPAVTTEFDAVRAATTSTRNFGFELLGMNIYSHAVSKTDGTFVVQTPEGAKAIDRVISVAVANGKIAGMGGDRYLPRQVEYIKKGARFITTNSEIAFIMAEATRGTTELRRAIGEK